MVSRVRVRHDDPGDMRPSPAALTATRASCSAVAAPAETPSTVTLARIVSATRGAWPSTTQRPRSARIGRLVDVFADPAADPQMSRPLAGTAAAAHAARSVAVTFASCCGPMTSAVGIPRDAAKTAS